MLPYRRAAVRIVLVTLAVSGLVAGCGGNDGASPNTPSSMTKVSGDSQSVAVKTAGAAPMVARVLGGAGSPLAGTHVSWKIATGVGTLSDTATNTGADGTVSVTFTADTVAGVTSVTASAGDLTSTTFTVTVSAGPVAAVRKFGIDSPAALKGTPVTLTVKVSDQYGNGVGGTAVAWTTSRGTLSAATSSSEASGVATIILTLGDETGAYVVTATAPGAAPVTITVTGV